MLIGGMTQAESPECIPASSICSMTAGTKASSPSEMASASASMAFSRNLSTRMGRSGDTSTAADMYCSSMVSSWTISMARPPSTYEGRTMTGYPISLAIFKAWSSVLAMPASGWGMFNSCMTRRNWSRSSAKSMVAGEVPRIFTPASASSPAILRGVWPPNWAMTPSGFSFSWILNTSSTVSGSKYSLSEVS